MLCDTSVCTSFLVPFHITERGSMSIHHVTSQPANYLLDTRLASYKLVFTGPDDRVPVMCP